MLATAVVIATMQALQELTKDPTRCFTFYDVTCLARERTSEEVEHGKVKELVMAFFEEGFMSRYDLSNHSFTSDGKRISAKLFHTQLGDRRSYVPVPKKAVSCA